MTYKILIADPISEDGLQPLRQNEQFDVVVDTERTASELLTLIQDFDGLIVRSQTQVTRELLEAGKRLKIIGRAGVGVDNIDLDAATENGIIVVNAPDGNTNSAAEHTIAMLSALARNIPQAYLSLKNGVWDRKSFVGVELKNKTLGIIGLGRIGIEVANRAKGQRMNVIAYDPFLTEERATKLGIGYGTLDDVLACADFITIHTPLLKETHHLLDEKAFAKMKDGVQLINCARGGIIDEDVLYEAIVSGKVAGAALDVFETEPFVDHKLLTLPQVIATPHLGASTVEAQESVAVDVSQDVLRYFSGEPVKNPVNLPAVPKEVLSKIEPFYSLAEKLGVFLSRVCDQAIEEVNIAYAGELATYDVRPLTRNIVKGLLKRNLGIHVNEVNARLHAERLGIHVTEHKTTATKGFLHLISIEIKANGTSHKVAGTLLNGLGARIVKVEDYAVDVVPDGHLLLIKHKDQPGAIGRVGTLLAAENINIATMQVGRQTIGGNAIMMLAVDNHVKRDEVERLESLEDIFEVKAIDL
ncbi:D-3-phosphoglycerate dehydrogenase [Sporosarcina sp. NCCP-2222]|uniref:phosphoglycerate dehydrogenase n=1 Tax=Sporosarcina sp. NCCP-2222 TaxID=2935073 RepID=UPI00207FC442|nr:phosphoglycerate dehydrogenase [Sporosarcina sp. NCCP-2222]GKV54751.1 D-3-phosphoglycerate dehydrogenase [Sporosarcina sp. NCCP-2222]